LSAHLARHEAKYAAAPKHGTILYNWGTYPFYGLLGTTIISKELFILDDAFPAVGLFGATFLFFTWQLGPAVSKMVHEKKIAIEQERHDTFDLIFALMDRSTDQIKASQNLPKLLEQYVVEYKAVANEASKAEVRQLQMKAYSETVAQLQALANQKSAEKGAQANVAMDTLKAHMSGAFTDPALISKTVDEALEMLSPDFKIAEVKETKGDTPVTGNSIVTGIYSQYVQSGHWDVDRHLKMEEDAAKAKAKQTAPKAH